MRAQIPRTPRHVLKLVVLPVLAALTVAGLTLSGGPSNATTNAVKASGAPAASRTVAPNKFNDLDCNGWSSKYKSVNGALGELCTDPIRIKNGKASRFIDNKWYVGHDEPSVKFISYTAGSGNAMTYFMTVPKDPKKAPTPSGSVTHYAELSPAPWFGLALCDPKSYPQNPCKPDSDANIGTITSPQAAGSAFMELQFYPPGFQPFIDNISCSATQWCAALTIDSLACNFNFGTCNTACEEPVNFAYLQTNGVPAGPPSPQLTDAKTFFGNSKTLKINQGDTLRVSISDPKAGFTTTIWDLTTHQKGTMTASAANGFMNTNMSNCSGTPFTFHAEYSTAAPQNQVPWAALEGGVLMEEEIGHFEACNAVTFKQGFSSLGVTDPSVYQTCVGGSEGPKATGEGPCLAKGSGISCKNSKTQGPSGPVSCPTNNPLTGALCEFSDGFCMPKGPRTVTVGATKVMYSDPVASCEQNQFQNGDLDFDGMPYQQASWPDGTANKPTPVAIWGPYQKNGQTYPQVQFETDVGGSSNLCNVANGAGCTAPPIGANFYPFYTLSQVSGHNSTCAWNFGTVIPGRTTSALGGYFQYGSPNVARYGGTIISAVGVNPASAYRCVGTSLVRP